MTKHTIISIQNLSDSAYVVRFSKEDLDFIPGQYITVSLDKKDSRPYSIYSSPRDEYFEILVKEVHAGNVSLLLRKCNIGESIYVHKVMGHFKLPENYINKRFCFIATGTGIAPFRSFTKAHKDLDYKIFHGISNLNESYGKDLYSDKKITTCTSKSNDGDFIGRVTSAIKDVELAQFDYFYLCGSYEMIDDVHDILAENGISHKQIKTEGYF